LKLTHSARLDFCNWHGQPAHCWLRVYQDDDRTPVVIATEMPDNKGVSVTNYAEELASQVQRMFGFPRLHWIEHYPPRGKLKRDEEFDLVEFQQEPWGEYCDPDWRPICKQDVEAIIGVTLEDMPEGEPSWLREFKEFLAKTARDDMSPAEVAMMIHEGLDMVETGKYEDSKTRFSFTFEEATDSDVAEIRRHLSPLENRIVEIKTR
jgi:hypothetical protein